jgi:Ca2+-binding EF-hand superfamily protein
LVHQLLVVTESIPKSKAELVFTRLQDSALSSANAGRAFLNLCSLTDLHLTGFITKEELIHICKMMDYPITMYDIEALCELLPNSAISKDNRSIDYRVLNNLLATFSPREHFIRDLDYGNINPTNSNRQSYRGGGGGIGDRGGFDRSGALPAYATPGNVSNLADPIFRSSYNNNLGSLINTPLGQSINSPAGKGGAFGILPWNDGGNDSRLGTPYHAPFPPQIPGTPMSMMNHPNPHNNPHLNHPMQNGIYEKVLHSLVDRIRSALQEKNYSHSSLSSSSSFFSLRKRFESNDTTNSGIISIRTLQYIFEEIGIILNSNELQVIHIYYGKLNDNDFIFYDSFCRFLENYSSGMRLGGGSGGGGDEGYSNPITMDNSIVYLNPKVLLKYKEMKENGKYLIDLFEFYDIERKGKVSPFVYFRLY